MLSGREAPPLSSGGGWAAKHLGLRSMTADQPDVTPAQDAFYSGAYRRILRLAVVLGAVVLPLLWYRFGGAFALGFAAGAVAGLLNFVWLKQGVAALADTVVRTGSRSTAGIVARFLLRYGLLALLVYVIFRGSAQSTYGAFAGLFLPIAASMGEAAYEAWVALRRGI